MSGPPRDSDPRTRHMVLYKKKAPEIYKRWPAVTASSRSDINGDQTPHILCRLCPRCVYILVRHYVPVIMCTHTPPFDTMEWSMIVPNIVDRQVNFSTFCSVSLFPFFSFLRSINYLRFYSNFGIDFRNFSYQFVVRLKVLKFYFLTQVNKIKFKKSFNNSNAWCIDISIY